MVFGKFISGDGDLTQVREIREEVFERELGIPYRGTDMPDAFCMHAVAYAEDVPIGTGRMMFDGERFAVAGIAVRREYRGQMYGDFLLRLLIDRALMANAQEIEADAREGTEGFFETVGFETAGETYEKLGARWIPMVLRTDRIHKCCDCGSLER